MDPEEKRHSRGGPEPDDLRAVLRHWKAPGAPAEIEDQLRQTFRQRRARSRRMTAWLALAAGLTLLVGGASHFSRRPSPSTQTASTEPHAATPSPAPAAVATSAPAEGRPLVRGAALRAPTRPAEPEIIVEPGQAELIARMSRGLNRATWEPGRATTVAPRSESRPVELRNVDIAAVAISPVRIGAVDLRPIEWPSNDIDLDVDKSSIKRSGGGV
jgi:hypothetical protein